MLVGQPCTHKVFSSSIQFALSFSVIFSFQDIAIDISDRPPSDQPQGIPYKLIGEACIPGITTIAPDTVGSIFEEHLIVKQLNLFQYLTHDLASGAGVYGEDENKFLFYNTIVGRKARARFRIGNPNKVWLCAYTMYSIFAVSSSFFQCKDNLLSLRLVVYAWVIRGIA